ncbi:MAG: HIT family protein [Candidatus Diapherotrites archaeon]|nr:HIT family protein [Candidatus Diapherotrites archaeon]
MTMSTMTNCLFCKIVAGEIPAEKVYENEKTFVFMDLNPVSKGHMLVIPKEHATDIFDLNEDVAREILPTAKRVAEAALKTLNADGVNLLNANRKEAQQTVFHYHMHVIPRYVNDGIDAWAKSSYVKEPLEPIANKLKEVL